MTRALVVALAGLAILPAAAQARLSATPHGPVDLGDRVAYSVSGEDCERVAVTGRFVAGAEGAIVDGRRSRPRPTGSGGCRGVAELPGFDAVRAAGWEPGERLDVLLVSGAGSVPLRYARMEADLGSPAAGSPDVVPAEDQDTGAGDRAVQLDPGDAISLGRVGLRRAQALAVRLCIPGADTSSAPPSAGPLLTPQQVEPPTYMSIRQDSPDGPPLVGPMDVAASLPQEYSRLSTLGFGGCYRLTVLPITGRLQEDAPEVFLRAEPDQAGGLRVNSVDVAGSGARLPVQAPPAPDGMETVFDGSSFEGWEQTGCTLRDGAAVNARGGDGTEVTPCSMFYGRELQDVVMRFRMRRENLYDNAGIYLGPQEIQLRSIGEYLPGGYFGQFAARWLKLGSFPDYDEIEVIQLGARHVVTVNGRTVTDVMRAAGPPDPYRLQVVSQPEWSYRAGAELGFGNEGAADVVRPSELGAFWFKDVRILDCDGPGDPVCRRLADARRGQVPVPEGAPEPLPPARTRSARSCSPRRSVVIRLPRTGVRRLRATVGGRRARVRRVSRRDVRVRVPAGARGSARVTVTGRTRAGRRVRVSRTVRLCTARPV